MLSVNIDEQKGITLFEPNEMLKRLIISFLVRTVALIC
jgi:hypothetical protein